MTKEQIIIELLKSLNMGNSCWYADRVAMAIFQYEQLVKKGIVKEEPVSKDPEKIL